MGRHQSDPLLDSVAPGRGVADDRHARAHIHYSGTCLHDLLLGETATFVRHMDDRKLALIYLHLVHLQRAPIHPDYVSIVYGVRAAWQEQALERGCHGLVPSVPFLIYRLVCERAMGFLNLFALLRHVTDLVSPSAWMCRLPVPSSRRTRQGLEDNGHARQRLNWNFSGYAKTPIANQASRRSLGL